MAVEFGIPAVGGQVGSNGGELITQMLFYSVNFFAKGFDHHGIMIYLFIQFFPSTLDFTSGVGSGLAITQNRGDTI